MSFPDFTKERKIVGKEAGRERKELGDKRTKHRLRRENWEFKPVLLSW